MKWQAKWLPDLNEPLTFITAEAIQEANNVFLHYLISFQFNPVKMPKVDDKDNRNQNSPTYIPIQ